MYYNQLMVKVFKTWSRGLCFNVKHKENIHFYVSKRNCQNSSVAFWPTQMNLAYYRDLSFRIYRDQIFHSTHKVVAADSTFWAIVPCIGFSVPPQLINSVMF